MKVLYFGSYDPDYPRNRTIIKGLRENGVEVAEYRFPPVIWAWPKVIRDYRGDHDMVIVGFPGHFCVPIARLLTKLARKPLVFDAFVSLYDSYVFDRRIVKQNSLRAKYYFYLDKFACMMSDLILLDTSEHIEYFNREFGIKEEKFRRIFVGTDDSIFYPRRNTKDNNSFTVAFYGTFIPLHGIQYIVRAAKLLDGYKDIKFEILGSGQIYESIMNLCDELKIGNIVFKERVSYEALPDFIARGDVCLGIFGETPKARRVIPNKVYEILAMGKPLITGDSPAAREILTDKETCILCPMASAEAIAESILRLKNDEGLRGRIAENGYRLFNQRFTPARIGGEVRDALEELKR